MNKTNEPDPLSNLITPKSNWGVAFPDRSVYAITASGEKLPLKQVPCSTTPEGCISFAPDGWMNTTIVGAAIATDNGWFVVDWTDQPIKPDVSDDTPENVC